MLACCLLCFATASKSVIFEGLDLTNKIRRLFYFSHHSRRHSLPHGRHKGEKWHCRWVQWWHGKRQGRTIALPASHVLLLDSASVCHLGQLSIRRARIKMVRFSNRLLVTTAVGSVCFLYLLFSTFRASTDSVDEANLEPLNDLLGQGGGMEDQVPLLLQRKLEALEARVAQARQNVDQLRDKHERLPDYKDVLERIRTRNAFRKDVVQSRQSDPIAQSRQSAPPAPPPPMAERPRPVAPNAVFVKDVQLSSRPSLQSPNWGTFLRPKTGFSTLQSCSLASASRPSSIVEVRKVFPMSMIGRSSSDLLN